MSNFMKKINMLQVIEIAEIDNQKYVVHYYTTEGEHLLTKDITLDEWNAL